MSDLIALLPWFLPAAYLAAYLVSLALPRRGWSAATAAGAAGLAAMVVAALAGPFSGAASPDAVSLVVGLMVAFLGWVIVRYSRRYLDGEPGQARYVAALSFTLAAAATVVVTGHLAVLLGAWAATSLGLHQLLTFYRERPAALVAAHKKFLVSRAAELCVISALFLIWVDAGTLDLAGIAAYVRTLDELPLALQAAAVLLALTAILKSAQLPLHGWLIQVMEAPTPVSALLHAGIVNIGGYVLIRVAELVAASPPANTLLVVVGSLTAVLAGLVMMTRISIKVRLAWSTCAQMGFLLMEVGLGLYDLALLHLVAHSLYKAYAFLAAGDTVTVARREALSADAATGRPAVRAALRIVALPVSFAIVGVSALLWHAVSPAAGLSLVALGIVGVGIAPLLWADDVAGLLRGGLRAAAIAQLYLFWHYAFAQVLPPSPVASVFLVAWVAVAFAAFYAVQAWITAWPGGALATALHPRVYAGFWLDERYTRAVFRLWPPRPAVRATSIEPTRLVQQGEQL
jgi:NAD(P)H-quinone oxidoreductase subunit 5